MLRTDKPEFSAISFGPADCGFVGGIGSRGFWVKVLARFSLEVSLYLLLSRPTRCYQTFYTLADQTINTGFQVYARYIAI